MFTILFGAIGAIFWFRYSNRVRREHSDEMTRDPRRVVPAMFTGLFRIRYSSVLMVVLPMVLGAVLDEVFNTTVRDLS